MPQYTHPDLPDFISPSPFKLGQGDEAISYARGWWEKASEQEIAALGFVEYVAPEPLPPMLEQLKTVKRAALANKRWQVETGGIMVGGIAVPTDRETQDRVDQVVKALDDGDIAAPIKFKLGPGVWADIDDATMRAIKAAGAQHIQTCFANECAIDGLISAAADQAALDAIDINAGWSS